MRPRHRMPTIFTISMVDMLCCSLGCVILLWLIKADKLKQMQARNTDAVQLLARANEDLDQAKKLLAGRESDLNEARRQLIMSDADAVALHIKLKDSHAQIDDANQQRMGAEAMMQLLAQLLDEANADVQARKIKLDDLERILAAFKDQNKELLHRLELADVDYDALQKKLASADLRIKQLTLLADQVPDLKSDLQKLRDKAAGQEAAASALRQQLDQRAGDLAAADKKIKQLGVLADRVPGLEADVKKLRDHGDNEAALADALKRELEDRRRELALTEKKLEAAQSEKTGLEKSLKSALTYREQLAAADETLKKLQKDYDDRLRDLTTAKNDVTALTRERNSLQKENTGLNKERDTWRRDTERLQKDSDNRFAGINLVGSRVVFLVDMSGSMDYIDDETRSPTKWKGVRETVRKVLRTLPKVEKFQVVAFSDKVIHPMGNEGKWLDFDPTSSPDKAFAALEAITPKGGTNMHLGLEAAFKYRNDGLDAIYFLSDGLPNRGPGITDEQIRRMSEAELGVILSKAIRKKLLTEWNRQEQGKPRVAVNTIGFFYESPDVGAFLWAMSRENGGSFVGMSEP
jgi:chromosome segregation ATPase